MMNRKNSSFIRLDLVADRRILQSFSDSVSVRIGICLVYSLTTCRW